MKKVLATMIMMGCLIVCDRNVLAVSTVVQRMSPTVYNISALADFVTTGGDMAGMSVAVYYSNGSRHGVDIRPWMKMNDQAGGAFGRGWSLTQRGDTFNSPWIFTVRDFGITIDHLTINAIAGGSVFDLTDPTFGTDGSMRGYTFEVMDLTTRGLSPLSLQTQSEAQITALYSDSVALEGEQPFGDLYGSLDIDFAGLTGFGFGSTLRFFADTDSIASVPEPQTMLLLGIGLIGLAAVGKNRFKR